MNILMGITGFAGAGKDTFALGLVELGFERQAFADALKQVTAYIADEPKSLYHDPVAKEQYSESLQMTRRRALQLLGTEGVRNTLGPDVWSRRLLRKWASDGRPDTVVTDVRFDNEADAIIAAGGYIVRVVRGAQLLKGAAAAHASEAGVSEDRVLITVFNDGTVEELKAEAQKLRSYEGEV